MSELPEAAVAPTEPESPVALADIDPARMSDAEEDQYGSSTGRRRRRKRVSVPTVDGVASGLPAAAQMPSLAENTPVVPPVAPPVAPLQQESTTEDSLQEGLRTKAVSAAFSLRHGTFRITETNKLLNFVLVPEDFDPESGDVVGDALAALGLTKPDIAFYFHKGGKLAEQRVVDQRVGAVMDGISAACAQTHSMYMLRQPYEGNRLAEIVCKSAAKAGEDCPILGLFHLGNLTRIDESRDADVRDEAFFEKLSAFTEYQENQKKNKEAAKAGEPEVDLGPEPEDPWPSVGYENGEAGLPIFRKWDAQRVLVGDTVMNPAATASSLKEVGITIDVSCRQTAVEQAMLEATGNGITGLAMLDRVTHAIVFADHDFPLLNKGKGGKSEGEVLPDLTMSSPTQKAFADSVVEQLPTGIISAGGSKPLFDSCVECLRLGRPVFCFRGTGGSTETVAKLIDFGNLKKGRHGKPGANPKQLENFIAREFTADKKLLYWREAKALACNFPEHFNPSAALVIEVGAPEGHKFSLTNFSPEAGDSVDLLQDQITKVMASVFDNVPELGGVEADARSVRHALALQFNLLRGATRYRREGSIIVTITRALGFATSVAAALRADEQSDTKDEMWLKWIAMALPLLLGVSASVLTTYRPIQKFAALKSAASEIESEIYRFRTRSRPYYASKSTTSGKGHRQLFSSTCDRILATHMTGDAALSAERLVNADQWLPKVIASVAPAAERGGTLATLPVLATDAKPEVEMSLHDGTSPASGDESAPGPPKSDATSTLGADAYTRERALPALKKAQQQAPRISRQLKVLQLLVIIGAAVRPLPLPCPTLCFRVPPVTLSGPRRTVLHRGSRLPRPPQVMVLLQSELPLWTPVVLTGIGTVEYVITYQQLESTLPAVNATALAITRVLVWWDGLSLIQQRMPNSKDRLVDVVESALVMQNQGFIQGAISNLGKELPDGDKAGKGDEQVKA